jgi:hypothetical protein
LTQGLVAALALLVTSGPARAAPIFQPANCFNTAGSEGCSAEALQGFASTAVASPDGKQVYSLSSESPGAIVQYDRDAASGALTRHAGSAGCVVEIGFPRSCTHAAGINGPIGMSFNADGTRAYVTAYSAAGVVVLKRDATTGELTALGGAGSCFNSAGSNGCTTVVAFHNPAGITVAPDGKNVYVTSLASGNTEDTAASIYIFDVLVGGALAQHTGNFCINSAGTNGCAAMPTGAIGGIQPVVAADRVFAPMSTNPGGIVQFLRDSSGSLTQAASPNGCLAALAQLGCTKDINGELVGTFSLAGNADASHLYVAGLHGVMAFTRSGNALTEVSCITQDGVGSCLNGDGLEGTYGMALSADGTDLAVGSVTSAGVAFLTVDTSNAHLDELPGSPGCVTQTGSGGACRTLAALGGNSIPTAAGTNAFYVAGTRTGLIAGFRRDSPPACTNASGSTPFGTPLAVTLSCSDPDGDPLTLAIRSQPANGTLSAISGSGVTYTPNAGFSGADTFTFGATAFGQPSGTATAAVTVAAKQDPTPPTPTPPVVKQEIRSFSLAPRSFRVGRTATFRFNVALAAPVTITIKRLLPGRRSKGRCVRPTKALRKAKRCTRAVRAGVLRKTAVAGDNTLAFTGRVGGKALARGSYSATLAAAGAKSRGVRFAILKSKKH